MDEVSSDSVVGLDLSRRGLNDLSPWLSPGEGEEPPLAMLETLDASRNALKSVLGLEFLPRLRVLNLYFNRIEDLAELLRLRSAASALRVLDLRLNPVTRLDGYRRLVLGALFYLRWWWRLASFRGLFFFSSCLTLTTIYTLPAPASIGLSSPCSHS